ncbi:hypothetical protein GJAV_G00147190 [Gymnothorax javanicus]|nr:hypothetical protein GJAV_G00147190 [Gymnothorax javanicus]
MNLKDITKWNVRVSMVYAIGIWTMIGSYGYLRLFRSKDENEKPQDTEALEELKDEHNTTQETRKPGFYVESTIRYRENFVPYSTRLMNFLKTLSGSSESTMESNRSEK